jgi:uncharacterized protein (DUF1501 family)
VTTMQITRRHFLRLGGTLGAATVIAPAWLQATELQAAAAGQAPSTGRKLVVMLLAGGNDGLNTVIPYGNGDYYSKRPIINIPQAKVLPLPGAPGLGLHPSLARLQSLYAQGRVAIVQGVGYDKPDLSHFGSMDIWQSGVPTTRQASGWLGRYLDRTPGRGGALRAVSIGNSLPKLLTGETTAGIAISSLGGFHFADGADTPGSEPARLHQGYLDCCSGVTGDPATDALLTGGRTTVGAVRSVAALARANSPSTATLADQVATAMTLLGSNLGVEIVMVTLGSFDDHAAENPNHDRLLGLVDTAIARFHDMAVATGSPEKYLLMTFSEFGRRVNEDGSGGTDHGTAAPMLLVGDGLAGGLHGAQPSLSALDPNGNMVRAVEMREVFATVLDGWLAGPPAAQILGYGPGDGIHPVRFLRTATSPAAPAHPAIAY